MDIPYVQPIIQLLKQCLFRVLIQSIKKVKSTSLKKKKSQPNRKEEEKKMFSLHCFSDLWTVSDALYRNTKKI